MSIVNTLDIQETDMAEAGLRIRVDDDLRREFIETCKSEDLTASQVLRAYMRSYIQLHAIDGQNEPGRSLRTQVASPATAGT